MAPPVDDETVVYRGVRASQVQDGSVLFTAFLLSARDCETAPPGLSVSLYAHHAFHSLRKLAGVAGLQAGATRSLADHAGHSLGLDVIRQPHPEDPGYAWITGLPPYAEEGSEGRSRAVAAANRLAAICSFVGGEPRGG